MPYDASGHWDGKFEWHLFPGYFYMETTYSGRPGRLSGTPHSAVAGVALWERASAGWLRHAAWHSPSWKFLHKTSFLVLGKDSEWHRGRKKLAVHTCLFFSPCWEHDFFFLPYKKSNLLRVRIIKVNICPTLRKMPSPAQTALMWRNYTQSEENGLSIFTHFN